MLLLLFKVLALLLPITIFARATCVYDAFEFEVGERYSPPRRCIEYICSSKNNLVGVGCPDFVVKPPCLKTPGNLSLLYPDCCPQPSCEEGVSMD